MRRPGKTRNKVNEVGRKVDKLILYMKSDLDMEQCLEERERRYKEVRREL